MGIKRTEVRMSDLIRPAVEPETKPISFKDCVDAMLTMWMDNVLTDGEYNRIMNKLIAHEKAERREQ
jgi:hypothetical protein